MVAPVKAKVQPANIKIDGNQESPAEKAAITKEAEVKAAVAKLGLATLRSSSCHLCGRA